MTDKELDKLKELDDLCNRIGLSYELHSHFQIGVSVYILFVNGMSMKFGGLDCTLGEAFEEALKTLHTFSQENAP